MKALLLAAGYATRLRPLSEERPKILFPLLADTILDRLESFLVKNGISSGLINAHHLAGQIEEEVVRRNRRGPFTYEVSREATILGTAGGVKRMMELAAGEDTFLALNGDIVCAGELQPLIQRQARQKPLATLALLPWDGREKRGLVVFDAQRQVRALPRDLPAGTPPDRAGIFTGIYLLDRRILPHLPDATPSCMVRDVLEPLLKQGAPIAAEVLPLTWAELGTIRAYFDFCQSLLPPGGQHLAPGCRVAKDAAIKAGAILHRGCEVGRGASVGRAILWPESKVPARERVEEAILTTRQRVELKNL